mgnify:CR=1 FL=1
MQHKFNLVYKAWGLLWKVTLFLYMISYTNPFVPCLHAKTTPLISEEPSKREKWVPCE